ncbi:MAG: hypothetical protein AB7L91_01175 [Dehalococcoidia bacterium]
MTTQSTARRQGMSVRSAARRPALGTNSIVAIIDERGAAIAAREALIAAAGLGGYVVSSDGALDGLTRDRDLRDMLRGHAEAGESLLVVLDAGPAHDAIAVLQRHAAGCVYRCGRWTVERIQAPVRD